MPGANRVPLEMLEPKLINSPRLPNSPVPRPPTPDTLPLLFPRNSWHSTECFGLPPFEDEGGPARYEMCWAAREASRTFSRVIGQPDIVDRQPTYYETKIYPPSPDRIDRLCFILAVFDKMHEVNWYFMHDRYKKADPAPLSYKRWLRDTTDYIDYLYDVACSYLPDGMIPPPLADVRPVVRQGLDLWLDDCLLDDYPPDDDLPEKLPIPLERFASKYYDHKNWVMRSNSTEFVTGWIEYPAHPLPAAFAHTPSLPMASASTSQQL